MPPLKTMERRLEIKKLIEEIGLFNINRTALAEKYGVRYETINRDIKWILKAASTKEVKEVGVALHFAFAKSLKEAQKILFYSSNAKEKLDAIKAIVDIGKEYGKVLSAFRLKDDDIEEQTNITKIHTDNIEMIKNLYKEWLSNKKIQTASI